MTGANRHGKPRRFLTARELFFEHDGLRGAMAQNGVLADYVAFEVPEELERQWLKDLTAAKVSALKSPGNWWSVHFLVSHRDCSHLTDVLKTKPLGVLWQRIAYVEEQLSYVEMCARRLSHVSDATAAIEQVLTNCLDLRRSCRSDRSKHRVDQLAVKAGQARSALLPGS